MLPHGLGREDKFGSHSHHASHRMNIAPTAGHDVGGGRVGLRSGLPALNPCCEHGFPGWDPVSGSKRNNLLHLPIVSPAGARIAQDRLMIVGYFGMFSTMAASAVTAKECLQSAEVCLALAHETRELDTRAALLEFAYEFRTVAKRLERDERKLMVRAASDGTQKYK
jgi:hypothetical protein